MTIARIVLLALAVATTLRFTTPTTNEDSTPCTDLASVRLYRNDSILVASHFQRDTGVADSFNIPDSLSGRFDARAVDLWGNVSKPGNPHYIGGNASVPEEPAPGEPHHPSDRCGGRP